MQEKIVKVGEKKFSIPSDAEVIGLITETPDSFFWHIKSGPLSFLNGGSVSPLEVLDG